MPDIMIDGYKIEKQEIRYLHFPKEEVLTSKEEIELRNEKLTRATVIGNLEKVKCKIFFIDEKTILIVETTIWATCEKNIVLKHGITIPIKRILDVVI